MEDNNRSYTIINQITGRMMDQIVVYIADDKTKHEFEQFVQQVDILKVTVQKLLEETQLLFDSSDSKYLIR